MLSRAGLTQRAVALALLLASASAGCSSNMDCALNGQCNTGSGVCACNKGWTGDDCSQLNLMPVVQGSGLHLANTSSWGSSIAPLNAATAAGGEVWMFASVFQNCGLTSWTRNSYIAASRSSSGLSGTFEIVQTAIPQWSHNVVFLNVSTPSAPGYLIFHIGDGKEGPGNDQQCSPDATAPANGTSQCGLLWFPCEAPPTCDDMPAIDGYDCVSYACSGSDPWTWHADESSDDSGSNAGAGAGLRDDVNCGQRLKDVMLPGCIGADECAVEAAGACAATPGCVSFAVSSFLNNYSWAMLFSVGPSGLRPNAQWNTYINKNATNASMYSVHTSALQPNLRVQPAEVAAEQARRSAARVARVASRAGSTFPVSYATSLSGPWTTMFLNTTAPTNGNNPAPFIASNGSVYVVFNDGAMSMFRSDNGWQGPYNLITTGTCGGGEDPFIWQAGDGSWHCLYHRAPFADPAHQAIGHAYSPDGFRWQTSPNAAATSVVQYSDGAGGVLSVTFGKRERPHLVLDAESGAPVAFLSAVGINPACDPFYYPSGAAGAAAINTTQLAAINAGDVPHCDPWVQYQRLDLNPQPAYYDRSWSLVQTLQ